jgi:L-iditol 2-dehydrogenase
MGASLIVSSDISPYRLEAAARSGVNLALASSENIPERLLQANEGRLADLVIVCTGANSAVQQALQSVERGGTILFFAPTGPDVKIPFSINDTLWRNDVTLTTSYAASPSDYQTALDLIQSGTVEVDSLITHRLPMAEIGAGFELVASAQKSIKVIIQPQL